MLRQEADLFTQEKVTTCDWDTFSYSVALNSRRWSQLSYGTGRSLCLPSRHTNLVSSSLIHQCPRSHLKPCTQAAQ